MLAVLNRSHSRAENYPVDSRAYRSNHEEKEEQVARAALWGSILYVVWASISQHMTRLPSQLCAPI